MVTPGFPPDVGGIENVVLNVTEGLVKRGHEVYVLTTTEQKKEVGLRIIRGIKVERIHAFSPGNSYNFSTKLGSIVRRIAGEFDIIHAHGYHAFPALNAYFNKLNVKFVLSTYYHRNSHSWFRNLLLYPYRLVARNMVNKADVVICISDAERNLLELDFRPINCRVIHVGTEIDSIVRPNPSSGNVIMIGRLEKYKNTHIGIEAIAEIEGLSMDIVGSGPEMENLKELVRLRGVDDRVKFHGFLEDSEKNEKLAQSMCLVTLSDYESFGIVIIEAAKLGVSTIASDIPSHKEISEVLEEGVTLVNNSELTEIVEAVKSVRKMENSVISPRIERFSWDYLVDRYIEAYDYALSSG